MRQSHFAGLALIVLGMVLQVVNVALSSLPWTDTPETAPLVTAPGPAEQAEPKAFFDGRHAPAEAVLVRTGPPDSAAGSSVPAHFAGEGCKQCKAQPVRRVEKAPVRVEEAKPVRRRPIRRFIFGR